MKKIFLIVGIVLALLAVGFFIVLPRVTSASASSSSATYTTQTAANGDLSTYVSGTGNVRPKQTVTLKWQTSGTVAAVNVKQGDQVVSGTVLSTLVQSSLTQDVINSQVDLATATQNLETVLDNSQARADAEAALAQAEIDLKTAQDDSQSMQFQTASQDNIDIATASLILAQDALSKATDNYNRVVHGDSGAANYKLLYADALSTLASARQKEYQAQINLDYLKNLPSLKNITLVNAELDQAKAKLLAAQQAFDLVKDGPDQASVAAAEAKVSAAQAIVNESRVAATFAGTVTDVYASAGDQVSSGTSTFQIEDLSKYLVDVSVSEVDVTGIAVGQPATITFDAITGTTYTGSVTAIASTGTNNGGSVNFNVIVGIDNPDEKIKAGMSASVDIAVKQLKDVLVVPLSVLRTVGSDRVVYVLQNKTAVPVVVTLGATTDTSAQVASGDLKVGDLIILNPTSTTTTTTTSTSTNFLSGIFSGISNIFSGSSGGAGGPSGSPPSGAPSGTSGGTSSGGSSSNAGGN